MESATLAEVAKYGLLVVSLILAVKWLVARNEQLYLEIIQVVKMAMENCEKERSSLSMRLQSVEDRQWKDGLALRDSLLDMGHKTASAIDHMAETSVHLRAILPKALT